MIPIISKDDRQSLWMLLGSSISRLLQTAPGAILRLASKVMV